MNKTLQKELLEMKEKDLDCRDYLLQNKRLYEGYDKKMESIHLQNAQRLDKIIQSHEWPRKTLVGKEGSDAAFLIAEHSISNPELQKFFLDHYSIQQTMAKLLGFKQLT